MISNLDLISKFYNKALAPGNNLGTQYVKNDSEALISFENQNNTSDSFEIKSNDKEELYKSDTQDLNKDSVWLSEVWYGLQNGEDWAIDAAKNLKVADDPSEDDKSSNAQLLRSNNELAKTIKTEIENYKQN